MKKAKKVIAMMAMVTVIISCFPALQVGAAAPQIYDTQIFMYQGEISETYLYIQNPTKTGKITGLKNSNPKVAKVSVYQKNQLKVRPKSKGTTKISFKYAGKKLSAKITVVNWENPCAKFKIGKKDYAEYFERTDQYILSGQKKNRKVKIDISPASGWKLLKIERSGVNKSGGMVMLKTKNHSNIKLSVKDGGMAVYAHFKNKKTGEKRVLMFWYTL